MKILIDGYNLIFECGLHGKKVNRHSLAQARERLLRTLASHLEGGLLSDVFVVFDARRQMLSGQEEMEKYNGITVLYSIHFDDADEMIEHYIQQHSAPKSLTVVSSDHRLHKAAAKRKASAIDSDQWWDSLNDSKREDALPVSKDFETPLLSEDELAQFKEAVEEDIREIDDDWLQDQ